jgi:hypothetical protein
MSIVVETSCGRQKQGDGADDDQRSRRDRRSGRERRGSLSWTTDAVNVATARPYHFRSLNERRDSMDRRIGTPSAGGRLLEASLAPGIDKIMVCFGTGDRDHGGASTLHAIYVRV